MPDRRDCFSRRQPIQRGLVERRLGRAKQAAALAEEPGLEGGCARELHPLEQLPAEPGDRDGLLWGSAYQGIDVHKRPRGEHELRRAGGQCGWTQRPPKLGQVPAQRAEWIIRGREQQLSKMPARGVASSAQDEIGDQPPALVAARPRHRLAVALEVLSAEQMDDERHGVARS